MRYQLAAAVLAITMIIPDSSRGYILDRELERTAGTDQVSMLLLRNRAGSVEITVSEEDSVLVTARFRIRAPSKTAAERILEETEFRFSRRSGRLLLEPQIPPRRQYGIFNPVGTGRTSVSIDYNVRIPPFLNIEVDLAAGDIILENTESSYKLYTGVGDIAVDDPGEGAGSVRTGRGSITAKIYREGWKGHLTAECGSGAVSVYFPEEANLMLEANSFRGKAELLFENVRPLIDSGSSVFAVFGDGSGRISLGVYRGDVLAGNIDRCN